MILRARPWALMLTLLAFDGHAIEARPEVKFSDVLYPLFMHERCLACHQFNSKRSQGRSYTTHANRYLCESCHRPNLTGLPGGGWHAPIARMDYTGLSPRETCLLAKRNVGAGDKHALLRNHLLNDIRIRWALESGVTPAGPLPRVPGGYPAWRAAVEEWSAAGMSCD